MNRNAFDGRSRIGRSSVRVAETLLGGQRSRRFSGALAKLGLRGLGINVGYDVQSNGERAFVNWLHRQSAQVISFDIGANVGEYSQLLLQAGSSRIVAFEPVRMTFERLVEKLPSSLSVLLENCAVGEIDGVITIDVPGHAGLSTLASRDLSAVAAGRYSYSQTEVRSITVDTYCAENALRPTFIKVDVEGYELEVLQGAAATLLSGDVEAVQFEFNVHHKQRNHTISDFANALKGFELFRLVSNAARPVDPEDYLATIYAYSNFIALNERLARRLEATGYRLGK